MPLQNRVTPFGNLVAVEGRGLLMGNRGRLHDNGAGLRSMTGPGQDARAGTSFPQKETTTMTLRSITPAAPMLLACASHPTIEVTR